MRRFIQGRAVRFLALTGASVFALILLPGEARAQEHRDGGSYGGRGGGSSIDTTAGGYEQDGADGTGGAAGGGGGAGTSTTRGNGGSGSAESTTVVGVGSFTRSGGAGGDGGINGITAATLSGLPAVGGAGGDGSPGSTGTVRNGGGGGAGGYGYVLTAPGDHATVAGQTIAGGAGGAGGPGNGTAGDGGDGGVGLFLQVGGSFTNAPGATLTGGIGGIGGIGSDGGVAGSSGFGGTGLLSSGGGVRGFTSSPRTPIYEPIFAATVTNAGTIAGGVGGASPGGAFFERGQGGIGVHLLGTGTLTNNASGLITGGAGGAAFAGSATVSARGGGTGGDGVLLGRVLPLGAENRTLLNEGRIQGGAGSAGAIADPLSRPVGVGAASSLPLAGKTGGAGVTAGLPFFVSLAGAGAADVRYTITNDAAGVLAGGAGGAGGVVPVDDGAATTLAASNGGDGGAGISHFGEPFLVVGSNVSASRVENAFGSRTAVGAIVNEGRIEGGAGGPGGVAAGGSSGDSGNGGAGVGVSGGTLTITNTGTIQGGDAAAGPGGTAGRGGAGIDFAATSSIVICPHPGCAPSAPMPGGFLQADVVIVYPNRANATIVNSGTIAGGLNGDGTRAPAIVFDAGVHTLRLQTGATFIGDVIVNPFSTRVIPPNLTFGPLTITEGGDPADNTLDLDGASTWTVSLPQFINFGHLTQTGGAGGSWTLTGAGTFSVQGSVAAGTMLLDPASVLTTPEFSIFAGGTLSASTGASLGGIGALRLDGGTLEVTGTSLTSLTNPLAFGPNGGAFDIQAAANTFTIDQELDGPGGLTKLGPGILALTGNNTYTGGTAIDSGTLRIGDGGTSGAIQGNVANAGTLAFNRSDATAFGGAISGTGVVRQSGAGTLTLSGDSSAFAGTTAIDSGTLALTGSLGGATIVGDGGRLTGTGTLEDLVVASGGTLAPGASIGTLTATGDVIFRAGSTYELELTAAGPADLLVAGGTATIEGGTVAVTALDPEINYTDGSVYTFLTAAGGLAGTFDGLTETSVFLDFALGYGADSAFVIVSVIRSFPDVALTYNQRQASTGLAALDLSPGADSLAVYNALLILGADEARAAFDGSSGEVYASLLAGSAAEGARRADRLVARGHEGAREGWGAWGGVSGRDGSVDGDGNAARVDSDAAGFDFGIDYRGADNGWALGAAVGYFKGGLGVDERRSSARYDGWHVGAYGRYGTGNAGLTATAALDYARIDARVTRRILFGTVDRTTRANVDVETIALAGELRYGLPVGDGWAIGPLASVRHASGDLGSLDESGAASLDLSSAGALHDITRWGGGLFANWQGGRGSLDVSAQYVDGSGNFAEVPLLLAGAPGQPFGVRSPRTAGAAALVSLAGRHELGGGWSIGGEARALAGKDEKHIAGSVTVGWRF